MRRRGGARADHEVSGFDGLALGEAGELLRLVQHHHEAVGPGDQLHHRVGAGSRLQNVSVAVQAAFQDIVAGAAEQDVVAGAAAQRVVPGAAQEVVAPAAAVEHVVAPAAEQGPVSS